MNVAESVFIQVEGVPSRTIMEEDAELKLITHRKLAEMRKRAQGAPPQKAGKTDREVVSEMLIDRGDEVLEAAYSYYPNETAQVVKELSRIIRDGRFTERISGGELYSLFRNLGLRFKLHTSIKVEEKGRLVDISEKLRLKEGRE